jgi:hypothetical protein
MSDEYPNQQQNYPGLANAKEYAAFARAPGNSARLRSGTPAT